MSRLRRSNRLGSGGAARDAGGPDEADGPSWAERQRERIQDALARGKLLHLTHGDCLDGMSAVGLVRRAFPEAVWVGLRPGETAQALAWVRAGLERAARGGDVGTAAPPTPRARLLVTDLSLGTAEGESALRDVAAIAAQADLVWLDHHEPQWPAAVEARLRGLACHLEVDRSGTQCAATLALAWLEALPRHPVGSFRLRRRDLFDEADHAAMAAVAHRDTFSDPDDPMGIRFGLASSRLRADYATLVEYGEYRAIELLSESPWRRRRGELARALRRVREDPSGVACLFGPAPLSDVAHRYWPEHPARLMLHFTDDGRLRVRSRPGFPHAHRLARRHGGGGHAHAAGATLLDGPAWRKRLYRFLGARDPAVRRVLRDARMLAMVPIGAREAKSRRDAAAARGGTAPAAAAVPALRHGATSRAA